MGTVDMTSALVCQRMGLLEACFTVSVARSIHVMSNLRSEIQALCASHHCPTKPGNPLMHKTIMLLGNQATARTALLLPFDSVAGQQWGSVDLKPWKPRSHVCACDRLGPFCSPWAQGTGSLCSPPY